MTIKAILWPQKMKDDTHRIKIYIHKNGQKKYIKTPIRIEEKYWDKVKLEVKRSHPLNVKYNSHLKSKIYEYEAILLDAEDIRIIDNPIESSLKAFTAVFIGEIESGLHEIGEGTLRNYKKFQKRLIEFEKAKHWNVTFKIVDQVFYQAFKSFLMNEKGNSLPGVGQHIKILKRLMRVAQDRKLHNSTEYQNFKRHRSRPNNKIYLAKDEIIQIEKINLEGFKELDFERDRFLISYYFLMRFEDSTRINKDWIKEMDGRHYLMYKQGKTGSNCMLPVSDKAFVLLEKWNYDFKSENSTANKNIKKVAALAKIDQATKESNREMPKWFFVTTHTARRSAATNLSLSGVSLKMIADLGGWKDLHTLRIYLRSSAIETAMIAKDIDFFK